MTTSLNDTGDYKLDDNCSPVNIKQCLEQQIITCVAHSSAIFKSQQIGEPDLTLEEKKNIALNMLKKSHSRFLSRFGKYLNIELLEYFTTIGDEYEITYHVNKLRRYFNSITRRVDRKNRRYAALKVLIKEGEYFSETAMMKRNPLLYENLIGKYLTEKEKCARDNLDTTNISLVNLLLESIEKHQTQKLKNNQEDAENKIRNENDSDTDSESEIDKNYRKVDNSSWGVIANTITSYDTQREDQQPNLLSNYITNEEKNMLKQEFVTHMYNSFLDGKDVNFDYSSIDDNEAYDNIDLRTQDAEAQYFDSETPEWIEEPTTTKYSDELEDELDKYMKYLKGNTSVTFEMK